MYKIGSTTTKYVEGTMEFAGLNRYSSNDKYEKLTVISILCICANEKMFNNIEEIGMNILTSLGICGNSVHDKIFPNVETNNCLVIYLTPVKQGLKKCGLCAYVGQTVDEHMNVKHGQWLSLIKQVNKEEPRTVMELLTYKPTEVSFVMKNLEKPLNCHLHTMTIPIL